MSLLWKGWYCLLWNWFLPYQCLIKCSLFVQNVWNIQASYVEYLLCDVTESIYKIEIYCACSSDDQFKCIKFTAFNCFLSEDGNRKNRSTACFVPFNRLLVQLEETERTFDDFWFSHSARLRQCLELRRFEQDFRELQVWLWCTDNIQFLFWFILGHYLDNLHYCFSQILLHNSMQTSTWSCSNML